MYIKYSSMIWWMLPGKAKPLWALSLHMLVDLNSFLWRCPSPLDILLTGLTLLMLGP